MASLISIDAEPAGGDVVERIEEVLAMARAGELSSIAMALVYRDGSIGHCRSRAPSRGLMLGALSRCMHKLNEAMD